MLDMQRYIAAAFRLAAIVILLPQAREIRHGLRPRRDRHRREEEHAQADSHRAIYQILAVSHSQFTLNPRGGLHPPRSLVGEPQNANRRAN